MATEKLSGTDAGLYYTLSDHLGSSSLTIDDSGVVVAQMDYYPYGASSYSNETSSLDDDYTFTGKESDEENGLQYFGARYYDNEIGKWASIDPAVMMLHNNGRLKEVTGRELQQLLADPQLLNNYTYGRDNPVVLVDPNGEFPFLVVGLIVLGGVLLDANISKAPSTEAETYSSPEPTTFAENAIPALKEAPEPVKLGAVFLLSKQQFGQRISRKIGSKTYSFFNSDIRAAQSKTIQSQWHSSTFGDNAADAILRHKAIHAPNISVQQYTDDATSFWSRNRDRIVGGGREDLIIKKNFEIGDGTMGYKVKTRGGGQGGIYTLDGKAVDFWYK